MGINVLIQILTAILNAHNVTCGFERYQVCFEKETKQNTVAVQEKLTHTV